MPPALPEAVAVRDLPAFPLIVPSRPNAIRMLIENELANLGLRPTIAFEVDGVGAILDLVGEGFGHAILSRNAVSNLGSGQALQIRSIASPACTPSWRWRSMRTARSPPPSKP